LCVFWYHSPNVLDTLHICNISWLTVKRVYIKFTVDWKAIWDPHYTTGQSLEITSEYIRTEILPGFRYIQNTD
jgi:hypothetical protein